jgi:hypothetical protein
MDKQANRDQPNARTLADLSALADGTLDPARAAAVREQLARSPELSERYERERRAVTALRSTRVDRAPEHLRTRIEAQRRAAARRPRRRVAYGGALTATAAALVVALILLLPNGTPGAPSVSQAASLALRGPALPAPAPDRAQPAAKLSQGVQEVYFPNWARSFGWRAVGQRIDQLGGRQAVTVYYERAGKSIAYTIVAAPALRSLAATTRWLDGTKLQSLTLSKRLVVTWRRAGHTCILSGAGVSSAELSQLAAWKTAGMGS